MDKFQTELLAQFKEHNRLTKELVKIERANFELSKDINKVNSSLADVIIPQNHNIEIFSAVKPKPADSLSIDEIVDILVIHGQHDPQFHLGETIKYSPAEIESILLKEVQKRGEDNA